jgi:hypothetical protein
MSALLLVLVRAKDISLAQVFVGQRTVGWRSLVVDHGAEANTVDFAKASATQFVSSTSLEPMFDASPLQAEVSVAT